MESDKNKHLYEKLKEDRPSILRMSLLTWVLWFAGSLVALACIILGVAIFIDTTAGKKLLNLIKDNKQVEELVTADAGDRRLSLFLAIVFVIGGILFYIIAFLSRRLMLRTKYIMDLEELMDDEMDKKVVETGEGEEEEEEE